jgi:hypothetical protein
VVANTEGKRALGRSWRRWEGHVKWVLKANDGVGSVDLAVVNMAMNIRVP